MKTMQFMFSAMALGLAVLAGPAAHAATIYSNLSGADTYLGNTSVIFRGPNVLPFEGRYAVSFTPGNNYTLDSVEVGLSSLQGWADDAEIALAASDSGLPGTVIESLGVFSGFPEFGTSDSFLVTANSAANPLLQAGVEYFIVVSAGDPDAYAYWNLNNQGVHGIFHQEDGGVWQEFAGTIQPTLRVNGTIVPTPTAAAMGGVLLGLFSLARTRRRGAQGG